MAQIETFQVGTKQNLSHSRYWRLVDADSRNPRFRLALFFMFGGMKVADPQPFLFFFLFLYWFSRAHRDIFSPGQLKQTHGSNTPQIVWVCQTTRATDFWPSASYNRPCRSSTNFTCWTNRQSHHIQTPEQRGKNSYETVLTIIVENAVATPKDARRPPKASERS